MMLTGAIKNELEKLYLKKRVHVIIGVILFFSALMVTLSYFDKDTENTVDWRVSIKEQVANTDVHLSTINDKNSDEYINLLNQKYKLEFYLKNDIKSEVDGAAGMLTSSVTGIFIKLIYHVSTTKLI